MDIKEKWQQARKSHDILSFSHPRLLFEIAGQIPCTASTFAMFNAQEMKSQSKREQAIKLGKIVNDDTFRKIILSVNTFDTLANFYASPQAATETVSLLLREGIMTEMQYPEMFDGDTLSPQGQAFLENLIIGKAFRQSPDAVRQITEFPVLRRNIFAALPGISTCATLGEYSLEADIIRAVTLAYRALHSGYHAGQAVSSFACQTTLFDCDTDCNTCTVADCNDYVVLMLADMANHTQTTRLRNIIELYNNHAKTSAAGQTDMFTGTVKKKKEILKEIIRYISYTPAQEVKATVKTAVSQRKQDCNTRKVMENSADTPETPDPAPASAEEMSRQLINTLRSFHVDIDTIHATVGTTLTLFEVAPAAGVRLSRIRSLRDDIALRLKVPAVRIIAPMPDGTVGIEVPHRQTEILHLSDILNSDQYKTNGMTLPLVLGKKTDGEVFAADLALMPHLLIAGATGQGKSVALNDIILSLLYKRTPDQLKLVLFDPKKVELSPYEKIARPYITRLEGLPPVITEAEHAQAMLDALCRLMDKRYTLLQEAGARNIQEYNESVPCGLPARKMEYYVIVIDEYGDLIMQAGKNVERLICRLAQKARAVGMHLIVSTQRPAATIVTGNIKANFPTRIAFRTTTATDSRVILDTAGAERLSGNGDMLYFSAAELTRVQCAYISTGEVCRRCDEIGRKHADRRPKILRVGQQQQSPFPEVPDCLKDFAKKVSFH